MIPQETQNIIEALVKDGATKERVTILNVSPNVSYKADGTVDQEKSFFSVSLNKAVATLSAEADDKGKINYVEGKTKNIIFTFYDVKRLMTTCKKSLCVSKRMVVKPECVINILAYGEIDLLVRRVPKGDYKNPFSDTGKTKTYDHDFISYNPLEIISLDEDAIEDCAIIRRANL